MYQNMMGSPGAPFGGQQVNGMGQQPMPAPRPMPMPNYGQLGQGVANQFNQYDQMGQQISGPLLYNGSSSQPGDSAKYFGNMGQQISGQMPFGGGYSQPGDMSKYFNGGGWNIAPNNDAAYGRPTNPYGGWGSGGTFNWNGGGMQDPGFDRFRGGYGGGSPWGIPANNDSGYGRPTYGGAPSPDGGAVHNPDMQNPFRTFNNGNPFYNAKGNLRMRYR